MSRESGDDNDDGTVAGGEPRGTTRRKQTGRKKKKEKIVERETEGVGKIELSLGGDGKVYCPHDEIYRAFS